MAAQSVLARFLIRGAVVALLVPLSACDSDDHHRSGPSLGGNGGADSPDGVSGAEQYAGAGGLDGGGGAEGGNHSAGSHSNTASGGGNGGSGGVLGGTAGTGAGSGGEGGSGGAAGSAGAAGWAGNGGAGGFSLGLTEIEGLTVTDRSLSADGRWHFELRFVQPADHTDPSKGTFEQSLVLVHRDLSAPMVLASTGYDQRRGYDPEPAQLLDANLLILEHRFFGTSVPDPMDWSLLDIQQSAADTHRVVNALKSIYTSPWISTGASKGGMTSIYHRRFYPEDVAGTVAYVAPISYGTEDARYIDFMDQVGGTQWASCREQVVALQVEALERRDELMPLIEARYGIEADSEEANRFLESTAIELPFGFWQYRGASWCGNDDLIPPTGDSAQALFEFVFYWTYPEDVMVDRYLPYYYQAYTELGYPGDRRDHIDHLLITDGFSIETWLPGVPLDHDPTVMEDIDNWVTTSGSELLFIYGELDPWTGGAFDLGSAVDSFRLIAPEANHGATMAQLEPTDRAIAYDALERWSGAPLVPNIALPRTLSSEAGESDPANDMARFLPPVP